MKRPRTRADCLNGPRPCPWVGCRHHLYVHAVMATGELVLRRPELEPWELEESCSLDVADRGPGTLCRVANVLGVTWPAVQQTEARGLDKLRRRLRHLRDYHREGRREVSLPARVKGTVAAVPVGDDGGGRAA